MERLGELLKLARLRRGKSQDMVAEEAGLTQSKYSRFERMGKTGSQYFPTPDELRRVGEVLGLGVEEMLRTAGYLVGKSDVRQDETGLEEIHARLDRYLIDLVGEDAAIAHLESTAEVLARTIRERREIVDALSPRDAEPAGTPRETLGQ